jgi:hypothetical protein
MLVFFRVQQLWGWTVQTDRGEVSILVEELPVQTFSGVVHSQQAISKRDQ